MRKKLYATLVKEKATFQVRAKKVPLLSNYFPI